jgi:hypothetical protein
MNLTDVQKQELLTKHLPILLVNTDDVGIPVDPAQFVKMSALWGGRRPELDNKSLWGSATGVGGRMPLVARGGLDLASLARASRSRPKVSQTIDELWLDCGGWSGGQDVDNGTDNRQLNVARLATLFRSDRTPVVSAEVCAGDTWSALNSNMVERTLGLSVLELSQLLSNTVLINYQMLFTAHTQDAVEGFRDGTEYAASNFEGDWVCFSLLLSAPNAQSDPTELQPRFALFERRFRNQSASFGENREIRRFESIAWEETPKVGSHPLVLVAHGTHNLYPADTATIPSGNVKTQTSGYGSADKITDDIGGWVKKAALKNFATAAAVLGVTLAKMAAGAAIAGPFGALAGLIAGIAEASPIAKALGKDPGPIEIDPENEKPADGKLKNPKDKFKTKEQGAQAYIVVADETIDIQQISTHFTFDATIDEVLLWSGRSREPVDRELERYWPTYDGFNSQGYVGRWGVRCDDDPFNRRAGDILPDYRIEVLRNILSLVV